MTKPPNLVARVCGNASSPSLALLLHCERHHSWLTVFEESPETESADPIETALEPTSEEIFLQPADLPLQHANNFDDYFKETLEEPMTLYRVWGGAAAIEGRDGTYHSVFPPEGSNEWLRESFAILPEWGNTLENRDAVVIPAGKAVYFGPAAPQTSAETGVTYPGGELQAFVPKD